MLGGEEWEGGDKEGGPELGNKQKLNSVGSTVGTLKQLHVGCQA